MEQKLIEAVETLTKSIDSLTAIQRDIFNTDTSFDSLAETRGKMQELIVSNEELTNSIRFLNAAVNDLKNEFKKR
jgi:hypothetical protein